METRNKIRELISGLSAEQRSILADEMRTMAEPRRPRFSLEDITPERVQDSQFAASLRDEICAALRGEI